MQTLLEVLESLDGDAVLQDRDGKVSVSRLLEVIAGSSELAEPATQDGDEIYLTTESGEIVMGSDPAYIIVK